VLVSSSSSSSLNHVVNLSEASSAQLRELIVVGDDPDALANFLGDARFPWRNVVEHVGLMIRLNRIRSLACFIPRIGFDSQRINNTLTALVFDSFDQHRPEICDFLLSKNFELVRLGQLNFAHAFWMGGVFNPDHPFVWTWEELVHLVTRHPRIARWIEPQSWEQVPNGERCLLMINFLGHLISEDAELAQSVRTQPNIIMKRIGRNEYLSDEEMIMIIQHFITLGAEFNEDLIDFFATNGPHRISTIEFLRNTIYGQEGNEEDMDIDDQA
jgi:hypothetical protein